MPVARVSKRRERLSRSWTGRPTRTAPRPARRRPTGGEGTPPSGPEPGTIPRGQGVVSDEDTGEAPTRARTRTEGTDVTRRFRAVHLHSRPHIDLQRVAGALCCS
ncbi:putative leader peptide [Streptomyces sp. NBC_00287]|uniref:putative leader peptide n=1 Tax=Streptomyces sp. NBC_00287 TaxID=2975702 RepID=UPI003FA6B2A0